MTKKIDVLKLAETRDKKLKKANEYFIKMKKLEIQAEDLDIKISNHCEHPKEHLKLRYFTDKIPQTSMWLCTICFQAVDFNKSKQEQKIEDTVDFLHEAWEEIPTPIVNLKK